MKAWIKRIVAGICLSFLCLSVLAESLPANLEARLIMRALKFEENLSLKTDGVSIYVLSDPEVLAELQKKQGSRIGKSKIGSVSGGNTLPLEPADVLFVGAKTSSDIADVMRYSQRHSVLTVADRVDWLLKGVVVVLSVYAGKPEYVINLSASKSVGAQWNQSFLSNAKVVE